MGLVKIFLSSTYTDLKKPRKGILDQIGSILDRSAMEYFIAKGDTTHKTSLTELKSSDVVIFLISTNYGSEIKKCLLKDTCRVNCGMKDGSEEISFTHCEYRTTCYLEKPHSTYLIGKWPENKKQIEELENKEERENLEKAWKFKMEIEEERREQRKKIQKKSGKKDEYELTPIFDHLSSNLIEWYCQGKLKFKQFCGRKEILRKWIFEKKLTKSVNVWGMGGIGKTTLCEVALLVEKLRGRNVVYIGKEEYYSSGTGCEYTSTAIKIQRTPKLNINAIASALEVSHDSIYRDLRYLLDRDQGTILYIDNYEEEQKEIEELIEIGNSLSKGCILISSIKELECAHKRQLLPGISRQERIEMIKILAERIGELNITRSDFDKISHLSEGHPIAAYILISLLKRIPIGEMKQIKNGKRFLNNEVDFRHYINRVIKRAITKEEQSFLTDIAILDDKIEYVPFNEAYEEFYKESFKNLFRSLIHLVHNEGGFLKWRLNQIRDIIQTENVKNHRFASFYYSKLIQRYGEKLEYRLKKLYHSYKSDPKNHSLNLLALLIEHTSEIANIPEKILIILSEISISLSSYNWADQELQKLRVKSFRTEIEDIDRKRKELLGMFIRICADIHFYLMRCGYNILKNRKLAIQFYSELLQKYYTQDRVLSDYIESCTKLVNAIIFHGKYEDMVQAINILEQALTRLSPIKNLREYAKMKNELANAHATLANTPKKKDKRIISLKTAYNICYDLTKIPDLQDDHSCKKEFLYGKTNWNLASISHKLVQMLLINYVRQNQNSELEEKLKHSIQLCGRGIKACKKAKNHLPKDEIAEFTYYTLLGSLYGTLTNIVLTYTNFKPIRSVQIEKIANKGIESLRSAESSLNADFYPYQRYNNLFNTSILNLLLLNVKKTNDQIENIISMIKESRDYFELSNLPDNLLIVDYNIFIAYKEAAERAVLIKEKKKFNSLAIEVAKDFLMHFQRNLNPGIYDIVIEDYQKLLGGQEGKKGNISGYSYSYSQNDYS